MPRVVPKTELLAMTGWQAPPSAWFEIDQERIDAFADATEDHQFIHVDPQRAAGTPFGGTVAHGYLTLSLLPHLMEEISVVPEGMVMAINYGLDKVRFLQPVRAGSRVRAHVSLTDVREKDGGRLLVGAEVTVEIENQAKPALVAETLALFVVK
ncbi:MAG: MaoC family dehydratase [Thermoanaerobaculia bacterium]